MKAKLGMPYPENFKRYRIREGKESYSTLSVMLHELFHIRQDDTFSDTVASDAVPYDDAESLASLYIEHLLLSRALNDGDRWRETAKDFLVLRNERRRLRPQTVAPEDYQERYEGTASYVELSGAPQGQGEAAWRSRTILKLMIALRGNHRSHRSRYYPSGAAMAMLLDRAKIAWKERVVGGAAIYPLLAAALPMSTVESAERLKRVRATYRLASLSGETVHLLDDESEQRRESQDAFMRLGHLTVILVIPPGTAITDHVCIDLPQANFDDGTEIAAIDFCSVRVKQNLNLDLQKTTIMDSLHVYDRSPKRWTPTIRFPLDAEGMVKLDGISWTPFTASREFKSLEIKDEHSHLVIRSPGRVSVHGRQIAVEWDGR
jgi:hypothetical protein